MNPSPLSFKFNKVARKFSRYWGLLSVCRLHTFLAPNHFSSSPAHEDCMFVQWKYCGVLSRCNNGKIEKAAACKIERAASGGKSTLHGQWQWERDWKEKHSQGEGEERGKTPGWCEQNLIGKHYIILYDILIHYDIGFTSVWYWSNRDCFIKLSGQKKNEILLSAFHNFSTKFLFSESIHVYGFTRLKLLI